MKINPFVPFFFFFRFPASGAFRCTMSANRFAGWKQGGNVVIYLLRGLKNGAGGGTRTLMPSLAPDFESSASAISPLRQRNDCSELRPYVVEAAFNRLEYRKNGIFYNIPKDDKIKLESEKMKKKRKSPTRSGRWRDRCRGSTGERKETGRRNVTEQAAPRGSYRRLRKRSDFFFRDSAVRQGIRPRSAGE